MKKFLLTISLLSIMSIANAQQPPVAVDDTVSMDMKSSRFLYCLQNDTDPDGDPLSIQSAQIISGPIDSIRTGPSIIILYADSAYGPALVQYIICDPTALCDTGLIYINVNYRLYPQEGFLERNNLRVRFSSTGFPNDGEHFFEAPKNSGLHPLFAQILIAGMKIADSTFTLWRPWNFENIIPGAIRPVGLYNNITNSIKWNRVWRLDGWTVHNHIQHYNQLGYQMPSSIANWPASGDPSLGEPTSGLAPYHDHNQNGFYDPQNGDYPIIKGDHALYFIFHFDQRSAANPPLEFHGMAYQFACTDLVSDNTLFLDLRLVNRSADTMDSLYVGLFTDMDIGYHLDDYFGTDVEAGMAYTYNGLPEDGMGSTYHYGANPPALGLLVLKGPEAIDDGIDNLVGIGNASTINGIGFGDGIVDNESWGMTSATLPITNPSANPYDSSEKIYSMLTGKRYDSQPHQTCAGSPGRFHYPGNSDTTSWYHSFGVPQPPLCTDSTPGISYGVAGGMPADRHFLAASGPGRLAPGESTEITFAYLFARDTVSGKSTDTLRAHAHLLRSYYMADAMPCQNGFVVSVPEYPMEESITLHAYPNPLRETVNITSSQDGIISIYDLYGREVASQRLLNGPNQIQLETLSAGTYVAVFRSESSTRQVVLIKM